MSTLTSSSYADHHGHSPSSYLAATYPSTIATARPPTPKRYFNLGLFCCCMSGIVFTIGLVLMVWGSSLHEPNAIWITGIVFLFTGGFLFFMGVCSISMYLSREDKRKKLDEITSRSQYRHAPDFAKLHSTAY